jgi:glucosamine-6-phosphate deaminase
MSVRQILKSHEIICVVPDARKAEAVKRTVEGDLSPMTPASILRTHANTTLYLDRASAALLKHEDHGDCVSPEGAEGGTEGIHRPPRPA